MARYNRTYYNSLLSTSSSPSSAEFSGNFVTRSIRFLWYRVIRRHRASLAVCAILFVLCMVIGFMMAMSTLMEGRANQRFQKRIADLMMENEALKSQNEVLRNLRQDVLSKQMESGFVSTKKDAKPQEAVRLIHAPRAPKLSKVSYARVISAQQPQESVAPDYFSIRSKLEAGLQSVWDFGGPLLAPQEFSEQRHFVYEWYRLMSVYVDQLSRRDLAARQVQQEQLGQLIRSKLDLLQRTDECPRKFIRCPNSKACGFGCFMHHLVYCTINALALNRTLLMDTRNTVLPVMHSLALPFNKSHPCLNKSTASSIDWNNLVSGKHNADSYDVIEFGIIDFSSDEMAFRPLAVPEQLRDQLVRLSEMPFVLFAGHVLNYIMTPNERLQRRIDEYQARIGLSSNSGPVLGLHIRRTDKIMESNTYPMANYMVKVDEYFDKIETEHKLAGAHTNSCIRQVYLATDGPEVWDKEVPAFIDAGYHFHGNHNFTINAQVMNRARRDAVDEVVLDIWMLSMSDHLVCTLSSQICRLAYELMQVRRPRGRDMSLKVDTLDDVYYFGGQLGHGKRAILPNKPNKHNYREHEFERGDILGISHDLHDGYMEGDLQAIRDKQTIKVDQVLRYPKFKVKENVVSTPFKAFG